MNIMGIVNMINGRRIGKQSSQLGGGGAIDILNGRIRGGKWEWGCHLQVACKGLAAYGHRMGRWNHVGAQPSPDAGPVTVACSCTYFLFACLGHFWDRHSLLRPLLHCF